MIDNGRLIAIGMLASFGFTGGFALSTIVSPQLDLKVARRAAAGSGGGQAVGTIGGGGRGAGGPAAGGGGGSGGGGGAAGGGGGSGAGGGRQGSDEASRDATAAATPPAPRQTAVATDGGARDGETKDAEARAGETGRPAAGATGPSQPCPFVALTGVKAAAFLSGNSVNDAGEGVGEATLGYFAPRGVWASFGHASIAVRSWNPKGEALCQPKPGAPQGVVCTPLRARQCSDAGAGAPTIGYLMLHDGRWSPVYRGNVQRFPDHIPALDPPRRPTTAARPERRGSGVQAASVVLDRGSAYRRSDAGPDTRDQVFVFAENGRRLDFRMPGEDHHGDVLIHTGWWSLAKGILCQGASREHAACARPTSGRGGRIALLPVGAASAPVDLTVVAEASQHAADDD